MHLENFSVVVMDEELIFSFKILGCDAFKDEIGKGKWLYRSFKLVACIQT
jgi:hypothetical protein